MEILFIVGILVVLTVCSKVDMKCVWRCVWRGKLLKVICKQVLIVCITLITING